MSRYRVKVGTHHEEGKSYKAGEVVESDRPLDVTFENKFEKLPDEPKAVSAGATMKKVKVSDKAVAKGPVTDVDEEPKDDEFKDGEESDAEKKASESLGDDVTDTFPEATEADVRVFRKDDHFFITEPDTPGVAKNTEPLTLAGTKKAIKRILKGTDE